MGTEIMATTTTDKRIVAIAERIMDGRLTLEQVRASKPGDDVMAQIESLVAERRETAGTPDVLDSLLESAAPIVTPRRTSRGGEYYDFSESGIPSVGPRSKSNWIPRDFVERLLPLADLEALATAEGADGLHVALHGAYVEAAQGRFTEYVSKRKRSSRNDD